MPSTASSVSPFLDNEKEHWDFLLPITIDIMRSRSPSLVQMTMVVILLGLLFADEVMSSPFIYSQEYCQLNPEYCKKRNAEIPGKVRVLHIVKKVTYQVAMSEK